MNVFSKIDFNKEGVDFLSFDDSFEFDESNKIIFGFNGIGKTTIYHYLQTTHKDNYYFMDYESKPKFSGSGKNFYISTDLSELNLLILERENIVKRMSIKDCFKSYGIKTKSDAGSLNNAKFNQIYNQKEIFEIVDIEEKKYKQIISCFQIHEIPELIKNMDEISKIVDISLEVRDYSEKYLFKVFEAMEGHYDEETKKCPVCGSENINLYEYIENKKKELIKKSYSVFSKFAHISSKTVKEQHEALCEVLDVTKQIKVETLITVCLSHGDYEEYKKLKEDFGKLDNLNERIAQLESKRENFYNDMSENKIFVKEQFEQIYVGSKLTFDDTNKGIKIELPRDFNTYSTGEFNELCLVIKLLSFKGSNKNLLIIDDPLSSYDFVNQYRIIFRIVKVAEKNKKVIVFSHNIDTINIINTQHSGKFKYYYIEKLNSKLILEEIKSTNIVNSILSLESIRSMDPYIDLLVYRENCEEGPLFSGHKVFHYDSPFTFTAIQSNEQRFNGLNNDYFIDLIENNPILYKPSFEENTITKIVYICGIRVWIEKQIRDFILGLPEPTKTNASNSFNSKNTTLEKLNSVQSMKEFKDEFPNYKKESFMMKKVMLNQDSHYKSQIIPFNFAMNISLDDLSREIEEVKKIFKRK